MSAFVDHAQIEVHSGKGGAGCVSFRREKYVPRGGPDGGDGGRGGDVVFRASTHHRTLLDYRYQTAFHAGNGRPGSGNNRHGKNGRHVMIPVPRGTLIINAETQEIIADLMEHGQSITVVTGGRGGKGNAHFKTATHQTPRFAQPGEAGQTMKLDLELKLIADVGLVGFPNAGKSTLVSTVSNARPKIADYPFTTLIPNLGVVKRASDREFVIADIPGIIEGSHDGKGLGDQFLRHIERTAVILLLVDVSDMADPDPTTAVPLLMNELKKYKDSLELRITAVVATKIDAMTSDYTHRLETLRHQAEAAGLACFEISAVTQRNTEIVMQYLERIVCKTSAEDDADSIERA
ncbi:GTPase ObgE [bacterium]|nr:GTPase ObgE [candidate division CSSED10-310 bacterium]